MSDEKETVEQTEVPNVEVSEFHKFMSMLSREVERALNPDGHKKIGFSLFVYDVTGQDRQVHASSNATAEVVYNVINPYLSKIRVQLNRQVLVESTGLTLVK
jgi:hypothetical protein